MKQTLITFCCFAVVSIALSTTGSVQQTQVLKGKQSTGDRQTTEFNDLIDRYFDSLNETDSKRRLELIKQIWTENGTFAYPGKEVKGHSAIDADVERVQKQYPGAKVRRTSKVELLNNNYVRFTWEFGQPGSKPLIGGVDFAVIVNGKLQLVVGFFDFAPNPANQ